MQFNPLYQRVLVLMKLLKSHSEKRSSLQANFILCSEMKRSFKKFKKIKKVTFSNVTFLFYFFILNLLVF